MSKLEFILQNTPRKMDSASFKGDSGQNTGEERSDVKPTGSDFDVFLNSISAKRTAIDGQNRQIAAPARLVGIETDSKGTGPSETETDSDAEQDDLSKEFISTDTTIQQQDPTHSLAANLISPVQLIVTPARQQPASSAAASSSLMELIRRKEDTDASEVMQHVANASRMKASVLHQEAHFKPILPNSLPNNPNTFGSDEAFAGLKIGSGQSTTLLTKAEGQTLIDHPSSEVIENKRADISSGSTSLLATDAMSDTPLFQRIADGIISDVMRGANGQVEGAGLSQSPSSIVLRPSEGVLRVLNIQLHPVELGVVTVKMRLSGEKLEMELHTSNSETADILRKDTEKLSGLLRTSGYRPDIITVHLAPADGVQQDNSSAQKQQWLAQSNSNEFQQDNSRHDDRAKYSAEHRDDLGKKVNNGAEEKPAGVAGTGGVYL